MKPVQRFIESGFVVNNLRKVIWLAISIIVVIGIFFWGYTPYKITEVQRWTINQQTLCLDLQGKYYIKKYEDKVVFYCHKNLVVKLFTVEYVNKPVKK